MRGTKRTAAVVGRAGRAGGAGGALAGVLLGALVMALGLAGCSDGDASAGPTAPSFAPVSDGPLASPTGSAPAGSIGAGEDSSAEPSAQPSREPSAVAPEPPVEAREQTPEGAVAFTQWWFDTLNYATATGDTEALREASDLETCGSCAAFIDRSETVYGNGGRLEGSQVAVTVDQGGAIQDGVARVGILGEAPSGRELDASGQVVRTFDAESIALVGAVRWADGRWLLAGLA